MQGLHGFTVHGQCRGLHGLYVFGQCSNRWCPAGAPISRAHWQLDDSQSTRAKDVFTQLDAALEQLLDDDDYVLRGKAKAANETERKLQHKLFPHIAWRLVEPFELFMFCPKDELRQWYVVYTWYILDINQTHMTFLLSSKGKPLITKARLESRDCMDPLGRSPPRLSTVAADFSMITISPRGAGPLVISMICTSTERRTQSLLAIMSSA